MRCGYRNCRREGNFQRAGIERCNSVNWQWRGATDEDPVNDVAAMALLGGTTVALAATKDDAVAMVKKAVALIKAEGWCNSPTIRWPERA